MVRLISFSIIALAALLNSGCFDNADKAPKASSKAIGEVELYTFSTHQQDFLGAAQQLVVPPSNSIRDALDVLGRELATTYFAKTYTGKPTGRCITLTPGASAAGLSLGKSFAFQ